jgi:hypothetical protein
VSITLVVMQPTVLPWAGYFNLMHLADEFVFHDDIQLEKRSWQTRNRLLFDGKVEWISVPILHVGETQKISETKVMIDNKWKDKLNRNFTRNYSAHPYFQEATDVIDTFLNDPSDRLSRRTESTIRYIAAKLGLHPRIHRASDLNIQGKRSDRLIKFCSHFNADIYLSPVGSADYLAVDGFAERHALLFQEYAPQPYPQANSRKFVSHLSIVDVVANLGWDGARTYVIDGHE